MTIGEVSRRSGLQPSAIRYYEQIGLLSEPARVNGRRQYDATVLDWIAVIRVAQEAGFTLADVKVLIQEHGSAALPSKQWQVLARRKRQEVDALILKGRYMQRILDALLECACTKFEDCGHIVRMRAREAMQKP